MITTPMHAPVVVRNNSTLSICTHLQFPQPVCVITETTMIGLSVELCVKHAAIHNGLARHFPTHTIQAELGDVVYVELPEVGKVLKKGDAFGVVESVKVSNEGHQLRLAGSG